MTTLTEPNKGNLKINKKKLLLVEGRDEINVFDYFLKKLEIHDVQIIDCGGKNNFKTLFCNLVKIESFEDVISIGFIRDADDSCDSAFQSITDIINKDIYVSPSDKFPTSATKGEFSETNGKRSGIFILPNNADTGMLETLYLESLAGKPIIDCIERCYNDLEINCPQTTEKGKFGLSTNKHKAKTIGTFMATAKVYSQLGVATQAGYWDFDHPSLDKLKNFLKNI